MGRLLAYDNIVQEKINLLIQNKEIQTGLIIGQHTTQKDIVLRLCSTPINDESDDVNTSENIQHKKSKSPLSGIDEPWICQHAKQLVRALPGGLDILGFFIVAPIDYTTKNQVHLRQILFSIYKMKNIRTKMSLKERVLVTICPMTSKIVCRTYDVSDYKSSATPAEWKSQSSAQKWHRLRCGVSVDIKFPIRGKECGNSTLQAQIELSLRPYFETVLNAVALVNGIQRNEEEPLDISTEGKKSKKKQSAEHSMSEWNEVQLYLPLKKKSISQSEIFTATSMMTFKGVVQCRGYVHGKATVQEAIDAIKQDIIRSITARCEIHCEDLLLIEEEQSDPLVVHELPRRVFAPLPQVEICVCDYQFHNDTASGSIDAFKELLDLEISEEEIDSSCEVSPTTSTLILPEAADDRLSEFGDAPVQGRSMKLAPVIGVAITIAVGVLAFLFKSDWS